MLNDINCPYCNTGQNIDHEDGYGYEEDETHRQECSGCNKTFVFTTSVSYHYQVEKAACLNGAEHRFKKTITSSRECTRMRCLDCDEERQPTKDEWRKI